MGLNFTAARRLSFKGVAILCLLCVGMFNNLQAQVTLVYEVDGNALRGGVCDDCSSGPDNRWRMQVRDNQWSTGWSQWNLDRDDDGCGWRNYTNGTWRNATSAPYGTQLIVQLNAWEYDPWTCGSNDGDCGGYTTVNTVTTTNFPPCTWNSFEGNRGCADASTWGVRWSYYWYYTSGFSAGSIGNAHSVCQGGDPGILSSASNGTTGNYIIYQWQYLNGGTWTDIGGANSSTYDPPSGLTATRSYRRLVKADQSCNPYSVASNTISVTVVQPGTGGTVSPASQTICASEGNATTLPSLAGSNGTITRWEYKMPGGAWTNWSGGGSTNAPNICCFNTIGTWQVRAVVQNSPCTEVYSSVGDIVVVADPSVSISLTGGAATHCGSGAATLTANGTGGTGSGTYQWQYYNGSTWVNTGGNSNTLATGTISNTTQYRCLYNTSGTNCTQAISNTITITINTVPVASISVSETGGTTPNDGIICNGDYVTITASGGTNYTWSNSLGTGATKNVNPSATITYTVTVSDASCSATASRTITVNSVPAAAITVSENSGNTPNDGTVCAGASLTLTGSGGTSYAWSNGLGNTASITITPDMNDIIFLTVSNGNCEAAVWQNIVVSNLPTPNAQASTPVCEGGTINLTADGGNTYAWSGPATYTATGAAPSRTNAALAMAGVYTVTVTNLNGCSATAATNAVNISASPTATVSYVSCPGVDGNTTIQVSGTGGTGSYQYRMLPAAFASHNTFSVANGSAGNNIEVRDAAGCTSTTLSFTNPMLTPTAIATSNMAATPCGSNAENRPVYIANGTSLIALVNDQGQNIGMVSGAIWFHAAPTVYNGDAFAKTSWTMHASNQPSGDVELNLPYTTATYNDLVATAAATSNLSDDISSMDDLGATRYWGANEDNVYNSTEGDVMFLRQDHNGTILNGHYAAVFTPGFSEYWLHGSQNLTALPVTLKALTAEAIDNKYIQINWTTALEIDNAGFALERSQDGVNFSAIEWIKGYGNSTIERKYSYDDVNVMPGTYYYRLKQVDNDGSAEYSAGMVSATIMPNGTIAITPNPTTGYINLNFPGTKSATVTIRTATGALVREDVVAPQGSLNLSGYADGLYFITINSDAGRHTMRVVKTGK